MTAPDADGNALREALERTYLEILPSSDALEKTKLIPDGFSVGITCSPTMGIEATLALTEALSERDLELIPHIAARQVSDRGQLMEILRRLQSAGVESVFVPGGDIATPAGRYDSSLALLREIADAGYAFPEVGVAAYPEGHPFIEDEILMEMLAEKQTLSTYFVTQICFQSGAVLDWLKRVRSGGIQNPAWIGLPGALSRRRLLSIAGRIGVGDSLRFARRQMDLMGTLLRSKAYQPDDLLTEIVAGSRNPDLGIAGFHLFSFNQIDSTLKWRSEMLDKIRIDPPL